ncbi:hypothetical protein Scep_028305 [Stephania cephalantha]|uniref:Uncharacterized protein n=1 Tax=Stephania cephalantha TaxID=152367 RepID=A0AAP0EDJ7_9MAGN
MSSLEYVESWSLIHHRQTIWRSVGYKYAYSSKKNLERAVIKVKRKLKGFYPKEITIPSLEGLLASISIDKLKVDERGVDSIQIKELFDILGFGEDESNKMAIGEGIDSPDSSPEALRVVGISSTQPPPKIRVNLIPTTIRQRLLPLRLCVRWLSRTQCTMVWCPT